MREGFQLALASEVLGDADVWSMTSSAWVIAAAPSVLNSLCPRAGRYPLRSTCACAALFSFLGFRLGFRLLVLCAGSLIMSVKGSRKRSR
jgi:hypothetical protein